MNHICDFLVDLTKPQTVQQIHHSLFTGNDNTDVFRATVFEGEQPVDFTGWAIGGTAMLANGATCALTNSAAVGNVASIVLPQAAYAVPGVATITMTATDGTNTRVLLVVKGTVIRTETETVIDPGTIIPSVSALIDALSDAQGAIVSAAEGSGVVTLTDANDDTYTVPTNAAFASVQAVANAISEEHPSIFCLGTVSTNKGVTVSADADGSLITFSGTSSSSPVTIPLFGQDDYSAAILPPGTYFVGEEQVTGENRLNIRIGDTTVSNQVVTITEAKRCYLRYGTSGVSFTGCSARYWIIPLAAPVKFVPHSNLSAKDLVARAAAEGLKDYIDSQIAGVMLAIAAL